MAKIAVFVPREYMKEQTLHILKEEMQSMQKEVQLVKVIDTPDAVAEARKAIDEGVHIVVARGVQAQAIKEYTKIPVVEIIVTSQELGLLIMEAKKVIKKPCPHIALIAFENMLGDFTYLNQLFHVDLRTYCPTSIGEIETMVEKAVFSGADIVIGGDMVNIAMEQYNVPSLFLASTEDSIRNALQIASKLSYTADVEKNSNAQFETILDTAFNGIVKINRERKIIVINRMVEELIGKSAAEAAGNLLEDEINELGTEYIESVLSGRRDMYSTSIKVRDIPFMIMVAPIQYDSEITGAIISFHRMESMNRSNVKTMQEMYLSGYVAKAEFAKFYSKDKEVRKCVELARTYSLSAKPVLIYGEAGTERELFAQCIHNNSVRKNAPFVSVNCSSIDRNQQKQILFGNPASMESAGKRGLFRTANYGTIYIEEVEKLSEECQFLLFRMVKNPSVIRDDIGQNQKLDVRIIVSTGKDLALSMQNQEFRKDLYYSINALVLRVPPLRKRERDIEYLIHNHLENFTRTYSRFIKISEGAMELLKKYRWDGNTIQIENFCERLFITSVKKTIDEAEVQELLDELYPTLQNVGGEERMVVYKHPEAAELAELLERFNGSRNEVAKELGISTTTLWRRMKKYGVVHKYNI